MKAYEIVCPECGAGLEIQGHQRKIYCSYCGTPIMLDDGIERKEIVHRSIDEAEIEKSRNRLELERMKMEEREKQTKISLRIALICGILFVILCASIIIMDQLGMM